MKLPVIVLSKEELKEIFALFSSPTDYERKQVYEASHHLYFANGNLADEYSLTQGKIDFAEDAWRAVIYFLYQHGYALTKDGLKFDLVRSSGYSDAEAE